MPKSNEQIEVNKNKSFKDYLLWFFKSFIWLAIILFALDIITKSLAYNLLKEGQTVKIPGLEWLVQFTLVFNTGAAWGFGGDNMFTQILLCLLSYAVAIWLISYVVRTYKTLSSFTKATLMIILAGDVGNLIDRTFALLNFIPTMYSKGVVDFIDITPLIPRFGIFNFADSCLCVGILMFVIYLIVDMFKDEIKNKKSAKNDTTEKK